MSTTEFEAGHRVREEATYGEDSATSPLDLVIVLASRWKRNVATSLAIGVAALGIAFLIKPTFTARTTFLPPQQQQSVASAALASLGALGNLAGAGGGLRTPADQYASLLGSVTIADRIVDKFSLMDVYEAQFRTDARAQLGLRLRVNVGKRDGIITLEVDDHDPERAAAIANQHVEELRRLTSQLALTEAQQRRVFFESHLKQTRDRLTEAQQALQASGFNQGALKTEPKAAAESYARLKAEMTAAEVRLQAIRQKLSDNAPEVQETRAVLSTLRDQVTRAEASTSKSDGPDYIGKYREFKYQETLFELFSRQYELARLDESRDGTLIQVIDPATTPERKAKPKRGTIAIAATLASFVLLCVATLLGDRWKRMATQSQSAHQIARLRKALGGR